MAARVLVVDDQPENLLLMTYLLETFGHETFAAADGREGVALAAEIRPDVIVMDLQMPKLNGFDAAALLKHEPDLRAIPIVAVTAYAMVGDRDKVVAAGFDGYITKPIDPETFVRQVEAFLPDRAARLAPQTERSTAWQGS